MIYLFGSREITDDPKYFENQLINTNYVKCIPTYSVINVLNKKYT